MTRARRAVWLENKDPLHWSVPVLYLPPAPAATPDVKPDWLARQADWLLDRMPRIFAWRVWLGMGWCLLAARLSHTLAGLTPWSQHQAEVILPLWGMAILPLIGAAMLPASTPPAGVAGRQWLLFKAASASMYTLMSLAIAGVIWLALAEAEVTDWIGRGGRQVLWGLTLLFITFFGYLGARHAWRMVYLALPTEARRRSFLEGWTFLGLVLPFFWPALYTALFFLMPEWLGWVASPYFFWLVVMLLFVMSGLIYRTDN